MSNSFDDKVYDYIKSNVDGPFPIGIRVKTSKDPPSTGTWTLVGIYGTHTYTDSVTHWMDFLGTSVLDCARGKSLLSSGSTTSWNYNSVLGSGNYTVTSIFGCYLNSNPTQSDYDINGSLSNGSTTYSVSLGNNTVTFNPGSGSGGANAQTRITITDLSKVSISDDGLSYEYERTA